MKYNFNWEEFTESDYKELKKDVKRGDDGFYGCVRCGWLCFDINLVLDCGESETSVMYIDFGCYVPYKDTGYGYKYVNGVEVPYDYADGFYMESSNLPFEKFKEKAEKELTEFINANKVLVDNANKDMLIW